MISSKGILFVAQYLRHASMELHKIAHGSNRNESENRLVSFLFEKILKLFFSILSLIKYFNYKGVAWIL